MYILSKLACMIYTYRCPLAFENPCVKTTYVKEDWLCYSSYLKLLQQLDFYVGIVSLTGGP